LQPEKRKERKKERKKENEAANKIIKYNPKKIIKKIL
jgi:hypothetical protein